MLCSACRLEPVESIYGEWELIKVKIDSKTLKAPDQIYLTINESNTVELSLEVNECLGEVQFGDSEDLALLMDGCTKECCDSQFSELFVTLFDNVYSIQFTRSKLILFNDEVRIHLRIR